MLTLAVSLSLGQEPHRATVLVRALAAGMILAAEYIPGPYYPEPTALHAHESRRFPRFPRFCWKNGGNGKPRFPIRPNGKGENPRFPIRPGTAIITASGRLRLSESARE